MHLSNLVDANHSVDLVCIVLVENFSNFSALEYNSIEVLVSLKASKAPFSYEGGTEMFRFGLPSTQYRFLIRHQMKTVA